ncbi:hypothetical protein WDU94_011614, partial [Cyamophila willieti]
FPNAFLCLSCGKDLPFGYRFLKFLCPCPVTCVYPENTTSNKLKLQAVFSEKFIIFKSKPYCNIISDRTKIQQNYRMGTQDNLIISGKYIPIAPFCKKISLGNYLCNQLKQFGKVEAMIDAVTGTSYSYEKILQNSLQLADALQRRGYCRGDIIAISSGNRLDYPVLLVATSLLGITLSNINPQYSAGELQHVLNLTQPVAVFCCPQTSRQIISVSGKFSCVREIIVFDHIEPIVEPRRIYSYSSVVESGDWRGFDIPVGDFSGDVAVVLTSSGTTGLPKGVMLTHSNVITLLEIVKVTSPLQSLQLINFRPVVMALVPFFHGYGLLLMLLSMTLQTKLVVLPHFEPDLFLSSIEKYKISVLPAVPPLLIFLAKSPLVDKYDLSSLMRVTCGAAPVGKSTLEQVGDRLGIAMDSVKQAYGMTELTVLATTFDLDSEVPAHSVGQVLPNMKLKVLDVETGCILGVNKPGELCFRGPLVMKGYIHNTRETANTIDKEGWLHTGDIGYYDEHNNLYIVDRLKELIKVKGFQVAPAELETLLLNHTDIADAAVIGKPDELCGEVPLAFVVKKPQSNVTSNDIQAYIEKLVSPQKRLRGGVVFVDAIPKNASGKILRRVLREGIKNKAKL